MKICMVGAGYVGLVSGACFADFGHEVVCVDTDPDKIARLADGVMPIYEPGLDELVRRNVGQGRLAFTTALDEAVAGAQAVFIAVGTPSRRGDGHADLTYVHAAARAIASRAVRYQRSPPSRPSAVRRPLMNAPVSMPMRLGISSTAAVIVWPWTTTKP